MSDMPNEDLIFTQSPTVEFGSNLFTNVPVILQYEDTPLVEVVRELSTRFMPRFTIYSDSGTKLAVVKGSRIHRTDEGLKAGLTMRHPQGMTVCELDGTTMFEVRRDGPAALAATAELFAPDGKLVRIAANLPGELKAGRNGTVIGTNVVYRCRFAGVQIGILLGSGGGFALGVSRAPQSGTR